MLIIDNFYQDYEALKEYEKTAVFEDIQNPVDGVVYPLICKDVPSGVVNRIGKLIGRYPENVTAFMRRSPKGVNCPHIFHNDISMGKYSLMLYLNTLDGGTGLARHKVTGEIRPETDYDYVKDQNSPDMWEIYHVCEAVENRACLFDATLFHVALPIGGYGEGNKARTVFTVFFS